MPKGPLFLRFINAEVTVFEMLQSFVKSPDSNTSEAAAIAMKNPPDLEDFRTEMKDAVTDIIADGPGAEFAAFVNNYMEDSLEEDVQTAKGERGQNVSRSARVKEGATSWIEGFICYNLCLYIRAFGLMSLKKCKVCSTFFNHKGKYAVYCSDSCKAERKNKKV